MKNQFVNFFVIAAIISGCSQYTVKSVDPIDRVEEIVGAFSASIPATELALFEDIPIVLTADLKL